MKARKSARLVLLNSNDELLLFKAVLPEKNCWFTAGGGVEDNETAREAAKRELFEETGIVAEIGPLVWHGETVVKWKNENVLLQEEYFLVKVDGRGLKMENFTESEKEMIKDHGWFNLKSLKELCLHNIVYPPKIVEYLEPILQGMIPSNLLIKLRDE